MNKSILLSVQPKHLANILNGFKTIEIRKSVPKDFKGWVNLYCTKGDRELRGIKSIIFPKNSIPEVKFMISTEKINHNGYSSKASNGKVVARFWFNEYEEIKERFNGDEYIIEKLDELCLSDYEVKEYLGNKKGYAWHIKQLEIFDEPLSLSDFYKTNLYTLKKAPQSYQFVMLKENT